jgi:PAS domain S-box-containing protein
VRARTTGVADAAANPWALFESIPEMVLVVGPSGAILYANEQCSAIVGSTATELIGRPIESLIPDWVIDVSAQPMKRGSLVTALHRSGHEVPVEISLSPLTGAVTATVATVRDVTERLETAALLVEAETRLDVLDDRDRIARELHDSVIQRLFAAGLHLQASTNRPDTTERVSVVVDEIDDAIREIRGIIFTLHRPTGFDSGLEAALRASIDEASRLLGHRPTLKLGGILSNISHDLGAELLAVLREAMTNVAKHAQATRTEVSLDVGTDAVVLIVYDDGVGMLSNAANSGGLGLRNIQERALRLGGEALFLQGHPRGTEIRWVVPRARL